MRSDALHGADLGHRPLRWLWLSAAVVALDQLTKWLAAALLVPNKPLVLLPVFNLTLRYNTGAAFSFLAQGSGWQRWLFVVLAVVVSVFIVLWLRRLAAHAIWEAVSLALILAGAVGNVVDRLWHGYVIDFLEFHYAAYYWPAFNVADSAISIGVAMLLIDGLLRRRRS